MSDEPTLRDICVKAFAEGDTQSREIISKLQLYDGVGDPDDPAYAILIELSLLHREQDLRMKAEAKRDEAFYNRLCSDLEKHHDRILSLVVRQQTIYKIQFRRLIAIHRERFANKLVFIVCLFLLASLAGIGMFHVVRWIWA